MTLSLVVALCGVIINNFNVLNSILSFKLIRWANSIAYLGKQWFQLLNIKKEKASVLFVNMHEFGIKTCFHAIRSQLLIYVYVLVFSLFILIRHWITIKTNQHMDWFTNFIFYSRYYFPLFKYEFVTRIQKTSLYVYRVHCYNFLYRSTFFSLDISLFLRAQIKYTIFYNPRDNN